MGATDEAQNSLWVSEEGWNQASNELSVALSIYFFLSDQNMLQMNQAIKAETK